MTVQLKDVDVDTVWLSPSYRAKEVVHLFPDCTRLKGADPDDKDPAVLFDDEKVCDECSERASLST